MIVAKFNMKRNIALFFLSLLGLVINPMSSMAQEAYAVVSPDSTTLTFYYDKKKASREGTAYELNEGNGCPKWIKRNEYSIPDNPYYTVVVFDKSFKDARPASCAHWFDGFGNLTKIEGISNLNTSKVTDMNAMFKGCRCLESLDLRGFNTSNVTDMSGMFRGCKRLTRLDLRGFNTSKVMDMGTMFSGCKGLTSLDVSRFDTSNVTEMLGMFVDCKSLTSLDVSKFNTRKVTRMSGMFSGCSSLLELDLSKFNTENVRSMEMMFYYCTSLKTIYVGEGWNTSKAEFTDRMVGYLTSIVGGNGTEFDSEIVDKTRARVDGGKAKPGYFKLKLEN